MEFVHAASYHDRMRPPAGVAAEVLPPLAQPFMISCPRCGAVYLAEPPPYHDEPVMLYEEDEEEAVARLDQACPDHPLNFRVGV